MSRAVAMNVGMLVTYDEIKERVCRMMGRDPTDTTKAVRAIAALSAGFCAALCCLPFDNSKTKIQKMKPDPKTGALPYKNIADCMLKTIRQEGP